MQPDFPYSTTEHLTTPIRSTIDSGDSAFSAVNLAGHGIVGLWIGPTNLTSLTLVHAPPAETEPAEADFEPFSDQTGVAVAITLPAGASSARVYVQLTPTSVVRAHWIKLVGNTTASADGEVLIDIVNHFSYE